MCFTFLRGDFMENRIKEYRKSLGLSQDDLAKACGVSRQTINAIENNKYDPSLVLAFQLSYVLGGTLDTIFMFRKNEEL